MSKGSVTALKVRDGLVNVITGLATAADKNIYSQYQFGPVTLGQAEIEAAFRTSWLVKKVHTVPPFDETREWRDWQAEDEQIEALETEEKRLGLRDKVRRARILARDYGGGAIVVGIGDANPSTPLPETIAKGGLKFITVLSRHQLTFTDIDRNPLSEFFGQPKMWQVIGAETGSLDIHPSRVIPFIGQALPEGSITGTDEFWGDPLLFSILEAMKNSDSVQANVAGLIFEAKVDTLKIPNLTEKVSTVAGEQSVMRRLSTAALAKSTLHTRIIDGEEEWDTHELSFANLHNMVDTFLKIASAASDIPATRLLGKSPDGMNSTGESDLLNYENKVRADQEAEIGPALDRVDNLLIQSALGSRPPEVHYTWAPLRQMTEAEKATIGKQKAETTQIYVNSGLIPNSAMAKAVQNQLVEDGSYPGIEEALADAEKALELAPVLEEPEESELGEDDPAADEGDVQPKAKKPGAKPKKKLVDQIIEAVRATFKDAKPRTLYVRRNLVNTAEFLTWAKSQGFETTTPAGDLHVTIAFSRQPVDWLTVGTAWNEDKDGNITIPPGGARMVEPLGDKGAVVLLFNSSELAWRHEQIKREAGASWDFESYQPHVTITYQGKGLDLAAMEPYRGKLVFGPEVFEEVVEDWEKKIKET